MGIAFIIQQLKYEKINVIHIILDCEGHKPKQSI